MKNLFKILAGITVTVMVLLAVGCGNPVKKEVSKEVVVNVEVDGEEKNNKETSDKWIKYTFQSDDTETARRQCQESYYFHLDKGETVTEIIETSDEMGNTIFYFKTRGMAAVAG